MNRLPFLRWWLFICTLATTLTIAFSKFDLFEKMYDADISKLSLVILTLFAGTTAYIGFHTYRFCNGLRPTSQQLKVTWFLTESMTTIGMIGTLIGFLVMLATTFANLDVTNIESIQDAIGFMAVGMSTALVTTLVGMIAGLLLRLQLVNIGEV